MEKPACLQWYAKNLRDLPVIGWEIHCSKELPNLDRNGCSKWLKIMGKTWENSSKPSSFQTSPSLASPDSCLLPGFLWCWPETSVRVLRISKILAFQLSQNDLNLNRSIYSCFSLFFPIKKCNLKDSPRFGVIISKSACQVNAPISLHDSGDKKTNLENSKRPDRISKLSTWSWEMTAKHLSKMNCKHLQKKIEKL